jgi:hypothetical protein
MPKYQMMYVHQEFMHSSGVLCTRLLLKKVPILNWAVRIPLPQPQRLVRLSSLNVEAHASATNESTAYATKESSSGVSGSTVGPTCTSTRTTRQQSPPNVEALPSASTDASTGAIDDAAKAIVACEMGAATSEALGALSTTGFG